MHIGFVPLVLNQGFQLSNLPAQMPQLGTHIGFIHGQPDQQKENCQNNSPHYQDGYHAAHTYHTSTTHLSISSPFSIAIGYLLYKQGGVHTAYKGRSLTSIYNNALEAQKLEKYGEVCQLWAWINMLVDPMARKTHSQTVATGP